MIIISTFFNITNVNNNILKLVNRLHFYDGNYFFIYFCHYTATGLELICWSSWRVVIKLSIPSKNPWSGPSCSVASFSPLWVECAKSIILTLTSFFALAEVKRGRSVGISSRLERLVYEADFFLGLYQTSMN